MVKSNFKILCMLCGRENVAKSLYKKRDLKVGVSLATISVYCKQGYLPEEYHASAFNIPENRGRVTLDDLYRDIKVSKK